MSLQAQGAGGNFYDSLPLLDVAEELNFGMSNADATPGVGGLTVIRQGKIVAPGIAPNSAIAAGMFNATTNTVDTFEHVNGLTAHRMARTVAQNGRRSASYGFPLLLNQASAPVVPLLLRQTRRFVWQFTAWREALEAGSLFMCGLQTSTGGGQVLPSDAFTTYSTYAIRSLLAENGGNWSIGWRRGFGASAINVVPTVFSPLVPRLFRFEAVVDPTTGVSMTISIDGQPQLTFTTASGIHFPTIVAGNLPWWGLSFGNQLANGANFDYVALNRFQVFGA